MYLRSRRQRSFSGALVSPTTTINHNRAPATASNTSDNENDPITNSTMDGEENDHDSRLPAERVSGSPTNTNSTVVNSMNTSTLATTDDVEGDNGGDASTPDLEMGNLAFSATYHSKSDSFQVVPVEEEEEASSDDRPPDLQQQQRQHYKDGGVKKTSSSSSSSPRSYGTADHPFRRENREHGSVLMEELQEDDDASSSSNSNSNNHNSDHDSCRTKRSNSNSTNSSSSTGLASSSSPSMTGSNHYRYNWKLYAPSPHQSLGKFLRWGMVGGSQFAHEQTDEALQDSLASLARCLHLLRDYLEHYGMPTRGGARDQELVLREVVRDLYAGGAPLWALEPVMQKAAEGLTGQANINWQLFPRKALLYNPGAGTTHMFKIDRGFNISKMSAMEGLLVRLASFPSNVQGVSNIPARFPRPQEFRQAARTESIRDLGAAVPMIMEESKLAQKILNLASQQQGLFYYVNSREYMSNRSSDCNKRPDMLDTFWIVSDEERELFSRLACQEAMKAIDAMDARANDPHRKTIYTTQVLMLCRFVAAMGACGYWFGGSWQDMLVSGVLGVIVAMIGTSSVLSKQERLVYEVVASFVVGLISALLALTWPDQMCFSAMGTYRN